MIRLVVRSFSTITYEMPSDVSLAGIQKSDSACLRAGHAGLLAARRPHQWCAAAVLDVCLTELLPPLLPHTRGLEAEAVRNCET